MYVYGLLTEPGEQSAEFTIYGSYIGIHKWVVVQINLRKALGKSHSTCLSQSVCPCIQEPILQAGRLAFFSQSIRTVLPGVPFIISVCIFAGGGGRALVGISG